MIDSEKSWRRPESKRIANVLLAVGQRVGDLQAISTTIGRRVSRFVLAGDGVAGGDTLSTRLATFRLLGDEAERIADSHALPRGTQIGIQLFDLNGSRTAWAGWPQQIDSQDQHFIASGKELLYTRQVSLYRILTHVIPVYDDARRRRATVLVDMPLEVNFKVNNKFLKSTSLADNIATGVAANVRFDYRPTPSNLPEIMDGYTRRSNAGKRTAAGEDEDGPDDSDKTTAGGGPGVVFPQFMELAGKIDGDKAFGLSGRALVHSAVGNPLFDAIPLR